MRVNERFRKKKKDSRQLSFDRAMRVEETLMQTFACQLSSTLILVWSKLKALVDISNSESYLTDW